MKHHFKKIHTTEEMVTIDTRTISSVVKELRKVDIYRCQDEGCPKEEKFYTLPSDMNRFNVQEYSREEVN